MAPSQEVASQRETGLGAKGSLDVSSVCSHRAGEGLGHDVEDCGDGWTGAWEEHREALGCEGVGVGSQWVTGHPQGLKTGLHSYSRAPFSAGTLRHPKSRGGNQKTWLALDLSGSEPNLV